MGEWFARNLWAAWALGAGGLAVLELFIGDFTLLMLATGAGAAAITGLVLPGLWWAQLLVFVVVSYLTLFLLRPTLLRRVRNLPGYQDSVQALVGSTGLATEAITATGGAVKVDGQVWSARSYDPNVTIEAGQHVDVFERDGIVLRVYPSDRPLEIEER